MKFAGDIIIILTKLHPKFNITALIIIIAVLDMH